MIIIMSTIGCLTLNFYLIDNVQITRKQYFSIIMLLTKIISKIFIRIGFLQKKRKFDVVQLWQHLI